jgi:hypothetical protein
MCNRCWRALSTYQTAASLPHAEPQHTGLHINMLLLYILMLCNCYAIADSVLITHQLALLQAAQTVPAE